MMSGPVVSVVTPSFNQAEFVEETILSVLSQDYPHIEYLVIDGGSTDGSVDIIRRYADRVAYWVSEPDRGQSHAINKGFRRSTGEILTWLNSDDTLCPGAVRRVVQAFEAHEQALLVRGAGNLINRDGSTILGTKPPGDFNPVRMLRSAGGVPNQPSVFWRRRLFEEIGGVDERLEYMMDWEYWIRIGLHYAPDRLVAIDDCLANTRIYPEVKSFTGVEKRARVYRQVTDWILQEMAGDHRLAGLRNRAYSASYGVQARLEYLAGRYREARRSKLRALRLAPSVHNAWKTFLFLAKTYWVARRGTE